MQNSSVCDRCGSVRDGHEKQCYCGNPYLINGYKYEDINVKEIENILNNRKAKKKWTFICPHCKTEQSFYTETPQMPFCFHCDEGELMIHSVDALEVRDLLIYVMDALKLTQSEISIKLRTSQQKISDALRCKSTISYASYKRLDKLHASALREKPLHDAKSLKCDIA